MANEANAVLAVGAIMVDLVCRVPRLPRSGEGIVVEGACATVGGCAFNAANALRQLGAPYELFAPVGSGMFAGHVERELCERGLDAPRVPAGCGDASDRVGMRLGCSCGGAEAAACGDAAGVEAASGLDSGGCVCFVEPDGERTMVTMPGIERHFAPEWFDTVDAARFGCGFASGYEIEGPGGDAIIGFFEAHPAIQFYYAPGPRIQNVGPEKTARINALRPVWHLNDLEALAYTGAGVLEEAGFALARACGNAVVITAGEWGSHLFEGDRHVLVPTKPVPATDTVGAGDAHLGALTAARAAGRSWEESLALANRVAGAVCGVVGATLSDEEFALAGIAL